MIRVPVVAALVAVVASVGLVAGPAPTVAEVAAAARADVVERVRAAAVVGRGGVFESGAVMNARPGVVEGRAPDPVAAVELLPGRESTVVSDEVGVSATFSGFDVDAAVTLTLGEPAGSGVARRSVVAETAGVVVGDVVEITATDASGVEVTSFPAELVEVPGQFAGEGPVVVDVVPGIALEFTVDVDRVAAAGVDPSTMRIFTRESAGEPWLELPSFFDAAMGVVRGESDHLSQFVVIGTPFVPAVGPRVVLDPDNDEAVVTSPAPATEFPYNWALVDGVRGMLADRCVADVVVTRPAGVRYVSRATRAGVAAAANPVATVGFGFNAWRGHGWGTVSEGGTLGFSRGGAADDALRDSFVAEMPAYTGRPAKTAVSNGAFPFAEFGGVPGAYAHVETLFLDNNFDRPVIDNGFGSIVDGAFRSLGGYLESVGFDCTDPATGGWPSPPSQAELARWRHLGFQNYQTYGADPVSFSTGNLVEQFPLFELAGVGGQVIDATLVYNSQDGRLSRVGAGWSFGLGARAQRFDDGSVLTVRGDGASFVFTPDGAGGYVAESGTGLTLSEAGGGRLRLADTDRNVWVFDAADVEGIGELVSFTDPQGATLSFTYAAGNPDVHQFLPLTSVTDQAGQTVAVASDELGRVTGFTLPDGRSWGLAYDGAGNLVSVTDAAGGVRVFTYDGGHRMLTATDPEGVTYLVNEYDAEGRVARQWDADGNERTFAYSPGTTTYVDNEGAEHVFTYDEGFRITGIRNPAGDRAAWTFDDRGNVTTHVDEAGREWSYSYDDTDRLVTETDPAGAVTRYTYTPAGDVASVTDPLGRVTRYSYDHRGLVIQVDQPDDTAVTYTYTEAGDLASSTVPSGATTTYGYDARGNLTTVTDPLGRSIGYSYDSSNRLLSVTDPVGAVTEYSWDAGDRLVSTTDPVGGVTVFGYDRNGNLTTATDPAGQVTSYTWDKLWRVVTVTDPVGAQTQFTYDSEDNLTSTTDPAGATTGFVLDAAYRAVGTSDPNGGSWTQEVDPTGVVTSMTDPAGAVTEYGLDAVGRTVSTTDPTGAGGEVEYDAVGRVVSSTDPAGAVTTYTYDLLDRVTEVTDPAGFVTEYVYDVEGNLVGVIDRAGNPTLYDVDAAGQVVSVTDQAGAVTAYEYDPAGRVTGITDPDGNTTTVAYDPASRVASVTDPLAATVAYTYDPVGNVLSETDPVGAVTAYEYDPVGRLVAVTDPVGAVTRYGYDSAGRQTATTDPVGVVTVFDYDPAGQLVAVTEAADTSLPVGVDTNVTTTYAYTPTGLLASVTNPAGAVTGYEYDPAGRPTRETDPTGATTTTSYDPAGRVASVGNGAGLVAGYDYDERGDVARLTRPDGTVSFEYDPEQRPLTMSDPTGVTGWIYDPTGRVLEQLDSNGKELGYTYTAAGLLASLTYPDGAATSYTYDPAGRPLTQTTTEGVIGYDWDPAGRVTGITRPNQVTTTVGYDPAGRATSILHTTPPHEALPAPATDPVTPLVTDVTQCTGVDTYLANREIPAAGEAGVECVKAWDYLARRTLPTPDPAAPPGASLHYESVYDLAGHVTASTRTITGPSTPDPATQADASEPAALDVLDRQYTYDPLSRLTGSVSSTGETTTYAYDHAGNRTGSTRTGTPEGDSRTEMVFDPAGRLTATTTAGDVTGAASYGYDSAGNRSTQTIGGVTTTFTHDPAGRLTGTSTSGRDTAYRYDGLDRQVTTTDTTPYGATTTAQVWDGLSPVFTDSTLHGGTALIRDPLGDVTLQTSSDTGTATGTEGGSSTARWLLGDARNTTATADSSGVITDLVTYADYGLAGYDTTGWASLVGNDGQPGDPTLGLDQYYSRAYDTTTGSWLQPDSWPGVMTAPQTLDRYAYVTNNPVSYTDLLGYAPSLLSDGGVIGSREAISRKRTLSALAAANMLARPVVGPPPAAIAKPGSQPAARVISPVKSASRITAVHRVPLAGSCVYSFQSCSTPTFTPRANARAPRTINCATDMKVGMDANQVAINQACGAARAQAVMSTQPQWAQNIYNLSQGINGVLQPMVPLIAIAGGHAVGGRAVAANTGTRLAQDIAVNPAAPRALGLGRSIGRASHNQAIQADIAALPRGVTDIRVNQQQVNALGQRVGINRPDLQYTLNGQRYYVEYEGLANPRGAIHQARILANDPGANFILRIFP